MKSKSLAAWRLLPIYCAWKCASANAACGAPSGAALRWFEEMK
jgi:hypothetical protein